LLLKQVRGKTRIRAVSEGETTSFREIGRRSFPMNARAVERLAITRMLERPGTPAEDPALLALEESGAPLS
jgi:hypothetical protein